MAIFLAFQVVKVTLRAAARTTTMTTALILILIGRHQSLLVKSLCMTDLLFEESLLHEEEEAANMGEEDSEVVDKGAFLAMLSLEVAVAVEDLDQVAGLLSLQRMDTLMSNLVD